MSSHAPLKLPYLCNKLPFHYGWIIIVTSFLSILSCLGLGRFAFGMLLPSMALDLGLNNSQTGFIGTINFIGYLGSVLLVSKLAKKFSHRALIPSSLFLIGFSMIMISQAQSLASIALLYFFTGIGSGFANVITMSLVLAWFVREESGKACGLVVGGSGMAILIAGQLIPAVNIIYGAGGWRHNWVILALIVLTIAILNMLLIRNTPEEIGTLPYSRRKSPPSSTLFPETDTPPNSKIIYHLGFIYFCFGFTYVIYATFFVSTLVQEMSFTEGGAGLLWSWVGILSLFSGLIFGTLSDKLGRKKILLMVFTLQTVSYLLIAAQLSDLLFLSIGLFGITAWSIPSIMIAAVGDYVGPAKAAQVFGFVTFLFGIGQISGPFLAGFMADNLGSFSYSFFMAAFFTTIAFYASLKLQNHKN